MQRNNTWNRSIYSVMQKDTVLCFIVKLKMRIRPQSQFTHTGPDAILAFDLEIDVAYSSCSHLALARKGKPRSLLLAGHFGGIGRCPRCRKDRCLADLVIADLDIVVDMSYAVNLYQSPEGALRMVVRQSVDSKLILDSD